MISKPDKNKLRQKRHRRVRGKLSGTADRPRLKMCIRDSPNDHPHGGGEGKAPVGRKAPSTPWGKPCLLYTSRCV